MVRALTACAEGLGHSVCAPESAADDDLDLALIDLEPEGRGIEAAARLGTGVPVVYLVGDVPEDVLARARATDPAGYVVQPIDERQLALSIQAALGARARLAGLERRNTLLQSVFDSGEDGLAVADADGRFVMVNRAAVAMLTRDPATPEDPDRWSETRTILEPDEQTPVVWSESPLLRALAGEAVSGVRLFVKGGTNAVGVHISVDARPLRDGAGPVQGAVITLRDATDRRKTEAELARSLDQVQRQSELLETVLDGMSDGVGVFDAAGRLLILNAPARRLVGIEPDEDLDELGSRSFDFRHADDMRPCRPEELPLARVLRGETFDHQDLAIRSPQGVDLHMSASGRPLLHSDGTLRGGVTIVRDVTESRARERELSALADSRREQKEAMDAVFESMADGVVAVDRIGNVVSVNRSAVRILRVESSRMREVDPNAGLLMPDQVTPVGPEQHPLARALRGESVDDMLGFVRHPSLPRGVHLSISARPLRDSRGGPAGAAAVFRDVTGLYEADRARQRAVDELQQQNRFMAMVFESISDGVVVANATGRLTMANASAERMFGMGLTDSPSDVWSAPYGAFYPDTSTRVPDAELPLARALRGETCSDVGLVIRSRQMPRGVHVSVNGRPMRNAAGEIEGGVITIRDVTQQVRAREALAQAFAHGRLEVVETILHNIGNAINSVAVGIGTVRDRFQRNRLVDRFQALAQVIPEREDDWIPWLESDPRGRQVRPFILSLAKDLAAQNERTLQTVDRVQGRVRHIVDIIRTQKSFRRGDGGAQIVHVRRAVADAVKVLRESLTKRGIAIDIDCSRAPGEIWIQESRFHQMLVNLIKNAIEAIDKLADSGGPRAKPLIRVVARARNGQLVLDVVDNGIGIDPKEQSSIFVAGYTTKRKGSGLGLHSAANFARDSGGEVRPLSSGVGRGTTMRVTLRLSEPPKLHDQGMAG